VTTVSARSPAWARSAMVATSNRLAVEAALWALGEGGTAVDAAVAADAVLGVVQPQSTGIGGDAFALVAEPGEASSNEGVVGFNGSGPAPAALTLERCLAPDAWHERSPLTVTVPGVVDAWEQLVERYGRLDLATTLRPALELAEHGFPVGRISARDWSSMAEHLQPGHGLPEHPVPGQRIANVALSESLRAIGRGGRDAHMTGAWGTAAVDAVQGAGGCLTLDDLATHRGEWVTPISGGYHDHEVLQLPPNGQGAAVLAALGRLAGEPANDPDDPVDVVTVARAIRAGMEDAHAHVADPRVTDVPRFWETGSWETSGRDTVYTAVVADGMAVSLITSVFVGFGSGFHAGGAALQNRGSGFSLDASHPNVVAGGKRPFHTIIPGMVRRDGRVEFVYGLVGGPMQPQGHVQVLRHLLDHRLDPQAALDRPRTFWPLGDILGIEPGFSDDAAVRRAATDDGWQVVDIDERWFGAGQVIRVHADGWLEGGSDPRHDGTAFGV
jgi:gamma-glutamyltranspeptidase / glutathione hydrolase